MPRDQLPRRKLPYRVRRTSEGWLFLDPPPPPEQMGSGGGHPLGCRRCWREAWLVPTRLMVQRPYDATLDGPITKVFPWFAGKPAEVEQITFSETECPRCGHREKRLWHPSFQH